MTQPQIQDIFKQRYNQTRWKQFLGKTFANAQLLSTPQTLTGIDNHVASHAQKLGYILLDENGIERQIAVYEVTLAPGIILERNRVGLRKLLRKFWKNIDAAFIAYHRPESANWRFTYVSELTGYDAEGEFIKIKTEPKRYTYLLGEGESIRTAVERFELIAKKGSKVTLDDVKEAFSVEKLSKAFFDKYKEHYDIFCKYMVSQPGIYQTIFNGDEKAIRDFNKKLLGRIVFLYFIQKKGWLGVPKNEIWGKGDRNFLTNHFQSFQHPELFYQHFLSVLFFDTLNTKRRDDLIKLGEGEACRIPFLNGGLFEEENKNHRNFIFTAKLFENLFNFFDQYNFTIYEDDPNDHTVAVDPEMLGHIFENLLEDNKDKGAYYTPKEIVHYMCQESLIEYLTTWFENQGYDIIGYASIGNPEQPELFPINEFRQGQLELEIVVTSPSKKIDRILIEKLLKKTLDDNDKTLIKQYSAEFNQALDRVKICDPAIGSGAFPMGLLHEIFTAKQTLHTFEFANTTNFNASGVKLNIIQNSIYGVDIERGAVDIARLRFWLSLIVDEPEPKALPNLDYKIVVGNSLVSKLGDDIIDIDWNIDQTAHGLFGHDLAKQQRVLLKKISQEQKEFFSPDSDKKKLSADIRNLKIDLLINQLELMVKTQGQETEPKALNFKDKKKFVKATELYYETIGWKNTITQLKKLKTKPELSLNFFEWKLDFPEVMNEQVVEKVGFDIVIGNPPYGANIDDLIEYFKNKYPKTTKGFKDIYKLFYNQALENLCKLKGVTSYITPNTFLLQPRYKDLRQFFLKYKIVSILNLGENVFDEVTVPTAIIILKQENGVNTLRFGDISQSSKYAGDISKIEFTELNQLAYSESPANIFVLENRKLKSNEHKLDDILHIKDGGIKYQRKNVGLSKKGGNDLAERLFYSGKRENAKDIHFFIGKDIDKVGYSIHAGNERYMRFNYKDICKPNESVYFNDELMNKQAKIIWRQTAPHFIGAVVTGRFWFANTIQGGWLKTRFEDEISLDYLCALLNSKYLRFLYNENVKEAGRVFPQVKIEKLRPLPIIISNKKIQDKLVSLVSLYLANKQSNKDSLEIIEQIDNLVYKLYELTYEEVKIIDPEFALIEQEYDAIKVE
ncbi:MAG: TaqI-like C-terminal specificity domain-containing protein [Tychonema bourrellyi B0820]|nr:TaqI-like C-terminal specificity domain-containing protein [Tychonema bourrellyi B0820]